MIHEDTVHNKMVSLCTVCVIVLRCAGANLGKLVGTWGMVTSGLEVGQNGEWNQEQWKSIQDNEKVPTYKPEESIIAAHKFQHVLLKTAPASNFLVWTALETCVQNKLSLQKMRFLELCHITGTLKGRLSTLGPCSWFPFMKLDHLEKLQGSM